jgi:hypothetical protein
MLARLLLLIALSAECQGVLGGPDSASVNLYVWRIVAHRDDNRQPVFGTAFGIQGARVLITSYQVIDGAKDIEVLNPQGGEVLLPARVLKVSKAHDIAVLAVVDLTDSGLLLSSREEVGKGQPVWAIGFPGAPDRGRIDENAAEPTMTEGIVNRTLYQAGKENKPILTIIQHDAKLSHGNGGGPLLNACGHVVGINTQIELPERALETYSYALGVGELRSLLDGWGITYHDAKIPCPSATGQPQRPLAWWSVALVVVVTVGALVLILPGPREKLVHAIKGPGCYRRHSPGSRRKESGVRPLPRATERVVKLTLHRADGVFCVLRCPADQSRQWTLGRHTALCDPVIKEDTVSRCHARLLWQPQSARWYVEDLDSSNGTWLDGRALPAYEPIPLPADAQLTLGELQLTVVSEG